MTADTYSRYFISLIKLISSQNIATILPVFCEKCATDKFITQTNTLTFHLQFLHVATCRNKTRHIQGSSRDFMAFIQCCAEKKDQIK